jgi:hypothetical protein
MAGIKDIKFLTRPVQKFQAGGTAGVLDFDAIPEIMGNVKRPNLMGDPTKIGLESLGPLFAMTAAGAYPAVSSIIKTPAGDVYSPSEEEIRKRQEEDAERAKNTGLVPPNVKNEPLITPTPNPRGFLDDANITVPLPQEDTSNITPIPKPVTVDDLIVTMAKGPEKKLIKGVNDTAEDIFDEVDQNIIDNVDVTSGFKYVRNRKLPSYATPEKKKLTLKLLKIAENDKSDEVFGIKFKQAYKNYVLGEDAAIPKDYFRGGFQSYLKTAKNILSYKNKDPKILNVPNPTTVRVSADGTKVTQLVGNTAGDPQTLWNNIEVGQPVTGDAKKRLRSEIIVGNETKNFRAVKYEITEKNKDVSSKLSTLKNLFEESTDNTHIYSIDHIQAPRFGGANANKENLTFIMEGPHNNLVNLPASKTLVDDVVKPKSRFEEEVYKKAKGLVDAVATNNTKRAEELSKEIFDLQNNFKSTFENVDFVVGEAFVPIKTGEKTADYVKYSDQVGLNDEQKKLVENLLPTYSNRPNQGVSVERSIDKLITMYGELASLKGAKLTAKEVGQVSPFKKKDGGLVGINHLTRPL